MSDFEEVKLYGKTSLSDIFKQIHKNNGKLDKQINALIQTIETYIKSPGDILILIPVIKDLLDVNVKNQDQLIKLASIAQKVMVKSSSEEEFDFGLSEKEKENLLKDISNIENESQKKILELKQNNE
jgi:hypothetical protein